MTTLVCNLLLKINKKNGVNLIVNNRPDRFLFSLANIVLLHFIQPVDFNLLVRHFRKFINKNFSEINSKWIKKYHEITNWTPQSTVIAKKKPSKTERRLLDSSYGFKKHGHSNCAVWNRLILLRKCLVNYLLYKNIKYP